MTLQENLNRLRDESLRIAVEHGFTEADVPTDLMLMVSEASEALEDHRAHHAPNEVWYEEKSYGRKPCGIPSEVADVVVRVLHFSGKHGIDIERAVAELKKTFWAASNIKKNASIPEELLRMSAEFTDALKDHDRGLPMGFIAMHMAGAILHAEHFADKHDFDLLAAIEEKSAFNISRPFKNGNKAI